ncbi:winged helix-turn-helix domain-containing protein [Marivita geojedonensis]|nr:winged helix-turn-helix domain-containing protein [Marivita geojedonensis]PRY73271.1 TolB-like protein [Marivita geojedonensis]
MTQHDPNFQPQDIRLGEAGFRWRDGCLLGPDGVELPLRAKSQKMLAVLLAEQGRILSKDRLSDLIWPDTVATDESIARCISDIRKALGDDGHDIVQTFPKQGYRINVTRSEAAVKASPAPRRMAVLASVGALAALVLLAVYVFNARPQEAGSEIAGVTPTELREAVAIIPFSASNETDRFLAAGLSDDLEIHLAEMSGIKIVAQVQSDGVENTTPNLLDTARLLDARYLVHGSVRQLEDNVSLSVRLIDGIDGSTIWADRHEGSRAGLMTFRDDLPEALLAAMSVTLSERDRQRLALTDTEDPEAFEEVMHARREISTFTYEGSLAAERHLLRAVAGDPAYARAYAELASAYAIRLENDWSVISDADSEKAFFFAERALELDPGLWFAHYALGRLHSVAPGGDTEAALTHLREAMSLQPDNDDPRAYFAIVLAMSGDLEDGLAIFDGIMATHPQPPFWYHLGQANILQHLGRNVEAETAILRCLEQMPNSPYCLRLQIAILARLGRLDDAEWAIAEYAILGHDVSLEAMMKSALETDVRMKEYLRESYELAGIE